jgi:phage portal protein BeeE
MFSTAVAHLALYGNAYLGKFVDAEGRIEQIALLHPDRVTVELAGGQPRCRVRGLELRAVRPLDGLVELSPIRLCRVSLGLALGLISEGVL